MSQSIRMPGLAILLMIIGMGSLQSQSATVSEETRMIPTYPFSDPNPIPILTTNPKIYPYHKFEGYSHTSRPLPWKVVTLENDYIAVYVLPEVGGKVWGAVDKATGKEFIYRNEVMKFRNIAMRGPWTSGGIEFNFGIIGHHPSTATPVDYVVQNNHDGSVSCIVGNIDLPSRTQWRVNITLPPDKAYFETKVLWYNPTPHTQSYYNWMTAAAFASEDLEFFTPGNQYLEHSGEAKAWPMDQMGRNLAKYRENNFGPSKSYHVVGEYNDFFGGYYHDEKFGFGHWAPYEEMPGQKLWLWALSRSGGIWEDLLTDTDGQYIEFQAGRLFDQYSPDTHQNPITQVPFESHGSDTWSELWFPIREIGGITEVSPSGVMHLARNHGKITIGLQALAEVKGTLMVRVEGKESLNKSLHLNPLQVTMDSLEVDAGLDYEVVVSEMDLHYRSDSKSNYLNRPFTYPQVSPVALSTKYYSQGIEAMEYREFQKAQNAFEECLSSDASHLGARIGLSEVLFRNGQYTDALSHINLALGMDTYEPHANYVAGNIYRATGDWVNSMESFGWAARSMQFRSAAYSQMAELSLMKNILRDATHFAGKALDYNRYNINALQVQAITARIRGDKAMAMETLEQLLEVDPLNHLAHYERSIHQPEYKWSDHFRSELVDQTMLELAISYYHKGQNDIARQIFEGVDHTLAQLWLAWLIKDDRQLSEKMLLAASQNNIRYVFPYRLETIAVLEWVVQQNSHWKFKYYLALAYWGKTRLSEAAKLMVDCQLQPDDPVFYLTRADLLSKHEGNDPTDDLQKALSMDQGNWRVWSHLLDHLDATNNFEEALKLASRAYKKWPDNDHLALTYAGALLNNGRFAQSIALLKDLHVLPFEGASASRRIYERAHIFEALKAMDKKQYPKAISLLQQAASWPERLGVGKPFEPDDRQIDFLLAVCYRETANPSLKEKHQQDLIEYTKIYLEQGSPANLLALKVLKEQGRVVEADALVQQLTALPEASKLSNRWVLANYQGHTDASKQLEQEMAEADRLGYDLLQRTLQLAK